MNAVIATPSTASALHRPEWQLQLVEILARKNTQQPFDAIYPPPTPEDAAHKGLGRKMRQKLRAVCIVLADRL